MKFKVTLSNLFVDGVKYRRGEIVELNDPEKYGTWIEPYVEVSPEPEEKPKRKRRTKAEMEVFRLIEVQDEII